ncbi:MAG: cobalamin synthesis protein P47K [Planctomycetota bacterium]|nr:cobalamin synthesis protein P47K [Planctomycetota bacterium]
MPTRLILVGGFLGAGKTTLLWEAARCLIGQGHAVGLVTNDQAPDLVDTAFLSRSGAGVREVAGSCFCCNFGGFMDAVQSLAKQGADIVIAEPVGSCTDLSATILQPVKDKYREIVLAPLTVLADPERVREALREKAPLLHPDALYILRLQLEEADHILLNKVDMLGEEERSAMAEALRGTFPNSEVGAISVRTGEGLDAWLAAVLGGNPAGKRVVEVDYDRYAEGEAVLGWLNAVSDLESAGGKADWGKYARNLLGRLHEAFKQHNAEIGHVKLAIESGGEECTANLTCLGGEVAVHGGELFMGDQAALILNARVQMPPETLEKIVRAALGASGESGVSARIRTLRCLMPGRPNPTHRYSRTV